MNHSLRRRCAAMVCGLGVVVLLAGAGCVPADSTGGATTTTDFFATLTTFVGDFLRQILAAFLF
ncbi:MAG TPA: hypothetical protein VMV94_08775 [Phycisphaerae bacterium]|nr:hypothetical protein [Phycisphaerae bacterium]